MEPNFFTVVFSAIAAGLALQFVLRLAYGVRGPKQRDPVYYVFRVISWLLLLPACGLLILLSMFGAFVPFLIMAFSWLEVTLARRSQKRAEAWSLVTRAAIAGRPVEKSLSNNVGRFRGSTRRALKGCVEDLSSGCPLANAIGRHGHAFPPLAQGYAALATNGGLPISLAVQSEQVARGDAEMWRLSRRFSYLLGISIVMVAILTFLMVAIIPEFEKIFAEFGLELPPISLGLVGILSSPPLQTLLTLLSLALTLLVVGTLIIMLCYALDWHVLRGLADRVFYAWRRADVLRLLSTVVESRMPLPEAIDRLGSGTPRYPSRMVSRRLQRCYNDLGRGVEWPTAMKKAGLINSNDAEVLRASQAAGNPAWALRSIAERTVARASFRWEAWQQLAFAVVILLFGLLVGWVCIALFVPLVKLIEGLT